ncbi:MAG: LysM peptidoglycan-binding domain-containing protein, partial [Verrucomicrobiota bacterium]|nr:LysM peptidoglycan-binding domain-containing protein [Verrucomicrobiota bacterium]
MYSTSIKDSAALSETAGVEGSVLERTLEPQELRLRFSEDVGAAWEQFSLVVAGEGGSLVEAPLIGYDSEWREVAWTLPQDADAPAMAYFQSPDSVLIPPSLILRPVGEDGQAAGQISIAAEDIGLSGWYAYPLDLDRADTVNLSVVPLLKAISAGGRPPQSSAPTPGDSGGELNAVEGHLEYTIIAGDSLWALAQRLLGDGSRWNEFRKSDGALFSESEAGSLKVGQVIWYPEEESTGGSTGGGDTTVYQIYTVKSGDTPFAIAQRLFGDGARWTDLRDGKGQLLTEETAAKLQIGSTILYSLEDEPETPETPTGYGSHVVGSGETLGTIAKRYLGSEELWVELFKADGTTHFTVAEAGALKIGTIVLYLLDEQGSGEELGQHVVKSGDTLGSLAQLYLGRADRWDELYKADGQTHFTEADAANLKLGTIVKYRLNDLIPEGFDRHIVKTGDTLGSIAKRYLGSESRWTELYKADGTTHFSESDAASLKIGTVVLYKLEGGSGPDLPGSQTFVLPGYRNHTVTAGQTLQQIAQIFLGDSTRWRDLLKANDTPFSDAEAQALAAGTIVRYPIESSVGKRYMEHELGAGETLWDLAVRFLGEGARWQEFRLEDFSVITAAVLDELGPGEVVLIPLDKNPLDYDVAVLWSGESVSDAADRLLGDSKRWTELRDVEFGLLNYYDVAKLPVGMVLVFPLDINRDEFLPHVVEPGESLFEIAEAYIGDGSRWQEIRRSDFTYVTNAYAASMQAGDLVYISLGADKDTFRRYELQAGETLADVAAVLLGDADRWTEFRDENYRLFDATTAQDVQPGDLIRYLIQIDKTKYGEHRLWSGESLWEAAKRLLGDGARWTLFRDADFLPFTEQQAETVTPGTLVYYPLSVAETGAASGWGQYSLQSGDTLIGIAERFLGDGDRWHELLKDDRTPFTEADIAKLQPGMTIWYAIEEGSGEEGEEGEEDPNTPGQWAPGVTYEPHELQQGEYRWGLAEELLGDGGLWTEFRLEDGSRLAWKD